MEKVLIVVNPAAGKGKAKGVVERLSNHPAMVNRAAQTYWTSPDSYANGGLKSVVTTGEHARIVVVGGDGTVNQVVNSLGDRTMPIGVIPAGTSNDFIKNLSLGKTLDERIETALTGRVRKIDVGVCNGRVFLNGVGIGFDGKVVEHIHQHGKKFGGDLAYLYTVLKILWKYDAPLVTFAKEGQETSGKVFMLTIANGTTFGGFKLAPDAKIEDGKLDVCYIPQLGKVSRFMAIPSFQKGTQFEKKMARHFHIEKMDVKFSKGAVAHLDGEFIGSPPFEINLRENGCLFCVTE